MTRRSGVVGLPSGLSPATILVSSNSPPSPRGSRPTTARVAAQLDRPQIKPEIMHGVKLRRDFFVSRSRASDPRFFAPREPPDYRARANALTSSSDREH